MESDTGSWRRAGDATYILDLVSGQHLQIVNGPLCGLEGTFVARRPSGVLLIRMGNGTYAEVSEVCVKPKGPAKT